jgi:hypothetical protein
MAGEGKRVCPLGTEYEGQRKKVPLGNPKFHKKGFSLPAGCGRISMDMPEGGFPACRWGSAGRSGCFLKGRPARPLFQKGIE